MRVPRILLYKLIQFCARGLLRWRTPILQQMAGPSPQPSAAGFNHEADNSGDAVLDVIPLTIGSPTYAPIERDRAKIAAACAEVFGFLGNGTEAGRRASRDRFVEAFEGSLCRLAEGRLAGDRDMLRRTAHQMIGQSRIVGAEELSLLAEETEQSALMALQPELAELSGELERQGQKLVDELMEQPSPVQISA